MQVIRLISCTENPVNSTTTGITPLFALTETVALPLTKASKNSALCVNSYNTENRSGDDGTANIVTTIVVYLRRTLQSF